MLADEINRTPPRTQAALLEAMQERHVTVDGRTHRLPTRSSSSPRRTRIEHEGIFPLPESQLDRFLFKIDLDYADPQSEVEMLSLPHLGIAPDMLGEIRPLLGVAGLDKARREIDSTATPEPVLRYIVGIVRATRELPGVAARRELPCRDPPARRHQGPRPHPGPDTITSEDVLADRPLRAPAPPDRLRHHRRERAAPGVAGRTRSIGQGPGGTRPLQSVPAP